MFSRRSRRTSVLALPQSQWSDPTAMILLCARETAVCLPTHSYPLRQLEQNSGHTHRHNMCVCRHTVTIHPHPRYHIDTKEQRHIKKHTIAEWHWGCHTHTHTQLWYAYRDWFWFLMYNCKTWTETEPQHRNKYSISGHWQELQLTLARVASWKGRAAVSYSLFKCIWFDLITGFQSSPLESETFICDHTDEFIRSSVLFHTLINQVCNHLQLVVVITH